MKQILDFVIISFYPSKQREINQRSVSVDTFCTPLRYSVIRTRLWLQNSPDITLAFSGDTTGGRVDQKTAIAYSQRVRILGQRDSKDLVAKSRLHFWSQRSVLILLL
jgi:hypothetical protein